ncbi:MAG: tetratricopeptide repeat protein [Bradymonadia bacterium]
MSVRQIKRGACIYLIAVSTLCMPILSAFAQGQTPAYPTHPLTEQAKELYNTGKYNHAVRAFRKLAQLFPKNAAVYRALARALSWANEPAKALKAYWFYQELAPSAPDAEKVKAEISLLLKRVKKAPSKARPKKISKTFEVISVRAKSGRFTGNEGAIGALNQLLESGYIDPKIGDARQLIRQNLMEHSKRALDNWWIVTVRAETKTLTELASAWELLDKDTFTGEEKTYAATMDGLAHLALNEPKKAAQLVAPVAAGRQRIRFIQAVALTRSKQYRAAYRLLGALSQGTSDARVQLLHGLVGQKLGKSDSVESILNALNIEDEP